MNILVTFASSAGPVISVAGRIGEALSGLGEKVTVIPMNSVTDPGRYDVIIAGSSIRGDKWLPEAMEFIRRNQAVLLEKDFAIFTVCEALAEERGAEFRMVIQQWTAPVRALVHPVREAFFDGRDDRREEPAPGEKSRFKLRILLDALKDSDHRHRAVVESWSVQLHERLESGTSGGKHSSD